MKYSYYHSDIAAVEMDLNHLNDTLMPHYWRIQKSRIKRSNFALGCGLGTDYH